MEGLWKPAGTSAGPAPWSIVILGGFDTGDRAALLLPDSLPVAVLGLSWPWKGPRRMSPVQFVARLPAIRAALLRTPAAVALGVAAVRRAAPEAPVALLGASLGVPPTVASLALTRPDALVLVDGAADLGRLLHAEITRTLGHGAIASLLAAPAAALGSRLVSPLEPARHAAAPGTPVLLLDAAGEERLPRECVVRLHATFPGAATGSHPGRHMDASDRLTIASIAGAVRRWLATLPAARRVAAP